MSRIKEHKLCMRRLMGESATPRSPEREPSPDPEEAVAEGGIVAGAAVRQDTFQFTSRVPPKKLRCLNI